jgi:hypothetical protein
MRRGKQDRLERQFDAVPLVSRQRQRQFRADLPMTAGHDQLTAPVASDGDTQDMGLEAPRNGEGSTVHADALDRGVDPQSRAAARTRDCRVAVHLHLIAVGVVAVDGPSALQAQGEGRHIHQVPRTGLGVVGLDLGNQVLLGELDQLEFLQVEGAIAGQVDE